MPSNNTPTKTLKQEKLWLIDAKKGEIKYDVTDDVNHGWWHRIPHGVDRNHSDVKIKS
jgi:hypothetical protein